MICSANAKPTVDTRYSVRIVYRLGRGYLYHCSVKKVSRPIIMSGKITTQVPKKNCKNSSNRKMKSPEAPEIDNYFVIYVENKVR